MNRDVLRLDPTTHTRHPLHLDERIWTETNCYVDLWIELLHALELDPVAAMGFTLAMDFEAEQWNFFKFPLADLFDLYRIDVQELAIWRPVEWHVAEQIAAGRMAIVEVDSFYLPDTAGTAYRAEHVKTSIGIQMLDPDTGRLGYFHNAGYFELTGDDYAGLFPTLTSTTLPPYAELIKLGRLARLAPDELVRRAAALGRSHFARRPADNPVARYRKRFPNDLAWLSGQEMSAFHLYAFATLRQCGACAELAGTFLEWLGCHGERGVADAAPAFMRFAESAKAMQFKLARAAAGRQVDFEPLLDAMEMSWDEGMNRLQAHYDD